MRRQSRRELPSAALRSQCALSDVFRCVARRAWTRCRVLFIHAVASSVDAVEESHFESGARALW